MAASRVNVSLESHRTPVPKLKKINTFSNFKLLSQFLGLLLLLCQHHSAEGLITRSKPYKKNTFQGPLQAFTCGK
jgi:hypothetical protein